MKISKKLQGFFSDSMWSIAGLVLMNVVAQFIVYPFWNRYLGNEVYGNVLYLISLMNIFAIAAGTACNNTRMVKSATETTENGDYGLILSVMTIVAVPFGIVVYLLNEPDAAPVETVLFILLTVLTFWRFYSDVRYRLNLDYRGYFCYYLVISLGYFVGIFLFRITGYWALALIPGEAAGIAMSYSRGSPIRKGLLKPGPQWKSAFRMFLTLLGSNMLSHIIFNGDRVLLNLAMGGSAVTIYYLASLLGKTMSLITTPLNSVIIGYLAKYKGNLTLRLMNMILMISLLVTAIGTAGCTVASHILISILYPQNYDAVKAYFWISNATQVIFFTGNITNLLLLRFSSPRYQVAVNFIYASSFVCLCIPATYFSGFGGFCTALLATSIARLAASFALGYFRAWKGAQE